MNGFAIAAAVIAFLSLVLAYGLASWLGKTGEGKEKSRELTDAVRQGAAAYLKRELAGMIPTVLVLFLIIGIVIARVGGAPDTAWITGGLYLLGAATATAVVLLGMRTVLKGSGRTVKAAMSGGLNQALKVAFRSGAVMGLCIAGLLLLGFSVIFLVGGAGIAPVIAGLGLGASTAALFSRGAGAASELYESCSGALIAAILIAAVTKSIEPVFGYPFDLPAAQGAVFPMIVFASGILGSMAGIMFVRGNVKQDLLFAVNAGKYLANIITVILALLMSWILFGNFNCAFSVVIGMLAGAAVGKAVKGHRGGSEYESGMRDLLWPMAALGVCVLAVDAFAGFYGIALAAVGMLSTVAMTAALEMLAPVTSKGVEIARMAELPKETADDLDKLEDAARIKETAGKGLSLAASAVTVLALYLAYCGVVGLKNVSLLKPVVIAALIFGAMLPVFLSALSMKTAENVSFKEIAVPGLAAFLAPLLCGILLGAEALGGLLAGSFLSGLLISVILAHGKGSRNRSLAVYMKLIALVSIVFAPVFLSVGSLL